MVGQKKYFIFLENAKEGFDTYPEFRKRAEELKEKGTNLEFCINWTEGYEYFPTQSAFSERMRYIRSKGCGLMPMREDPEKPWHYLSLNLFKKLEKQKLAQI